MRKIQDGLTACQRYYRRNREERKASNRVYCRANRIVRTEQMREWRNLHPFYFRDIMRRKREADPEAERLYKQNYRAAHRIEIRTYQRKYRKLKPYVFVAKSAKRRALKMSASVKPELITAMLALIRKRPTIPCYYCGRRISTRRIHADHVKALVKGGLHEIGNVAVSCSHCNLSKHDKPVGVWQPLGQRLLSL